VMNAFNVRCADFTRDSAIRASSTLETLRARNAADSAPIVVTR
jgi:hypothetical protein